MGSSRAWIYFSIFSDQIFLHFSLKRTFCYCHRRDLTSFINVLSVFYPHILIICIYYIPGMSSRALKCCAIFNRMFEKVGGRSNRLNSPVRASRPVCYALLSRSHRVKTARSDSNAYAFISLKVSRPNQSEVMLLSPFSTANNPD